MNEQPEALSEKPEALLLADGIRNYGYDIPRYNAHCIEDELRRLHLVNQELVEALEWAYRTALDHDGEWEFDWAIYLERIYQALAKAKGESNE